MKENLDQKIHLITLLLLIIFASSLIFFRLGNNPLKDYDEGIYANVAKEIVASGDWITLHFNSHPFFEKPPLYLWATAAFFSIFEINEFWARAVSAISGVSLVIITYLIGLSLYNYRTGVMASIILLSSYEFLARSRDGATDMLLSLFIYLAIIAYLFTNKDKKYWYVFWIMFAMAFMTKFWASGVVVICVFAIVIMKRQFISTIKDKHFWGGLGFAFILIIPWHAVMIYKYGDVFVQRYFFYDLIHRSTKGLEGNIGSSMFYFDLLRHRFSPWFLLIPLAIVQQISELLRGRRWSESVIFLVLIVVVLGVYSFIIQTKIFQYITPIYPAVSLLIGSFLVAAFTTHRSFAFYGLICALFFALMIATSKQILIWVAFSGVMFVCLLVFRIFLRNTKIFSFNYLMLRSNRLNQ
jgi:4-amino-4-deoxy-L-arabinose transferase-like glycosyltransferase